MGNRHVCTCVCVCVTFVLSSFNLDLLKYPPFRVFPTDPRIECRRRIARSEDLCTAHAYTHRMATSGRGSEQCDPFRFRLRSTRHPRGVVCRRAGDTQAASVSGCLPLQLACMSHATAAHVTRLSSAAVSCHVSDPGHAARPVLRLRRRKTLATLICPRSKQESTTRCKQERPRIPQHCTGSGCAVAAEKRNLVFPRVYVLYTSYAPVIDSYTCAIHRRKALVLYDLYLIEEEPVGILYLWRISITRIKAPCTQIPFKEKV